jgi:hypothetical protein
LVGEQWRADLRHNARIDRIQDAEGAAGFGGEHVMINDRRDEDLSQAR